MCICLPPTQSRRFPALLSPASPVYHPWIPGDPRHPSFDVDEGNTGQSCPSLEHLNPLRFLFLAVVVGWAQISSQRFYSLDVSTADKFVDDSHLPSPPGGSPGGP